MSQALNIAEIKESDINEGLLDVQKFLEFSIGDEDYGIPLLKVREVIAQPKTTPIPNTPTYFEGIMNLRGQVISILDLRKKLSIKPKENNSEEAVVILDLDPIYLGVIVDSVNTVLAVSPKQLSAPPDITSSANAKYITGIYRADKKMVVLIDVGKVLGVEDYKVLDKAA